MSQVNYGDYKRPREHTAQEYIYFSATFSKSYTVYCHPTSCMKKFSLVSFKHIYFKMRSLILRVIKLYYQFVPIIKGKILKQLYVYTKQNAILLSFTNWTVDQEITVQKSCITYIEHQQS